MGLEAAAVSVPTLVVLNLVSLTAVSICLWRRGPLQLTTALVSLWLCASCFAKTWFIQGHLDSPVNLPWWGWAWQALTLTSLVLLCQLLSPRHWIRLTWMLQLTLGALFFIDDVYERYFDDIPGLYLLTQLSQAQAAAPSFLELLKLQDLLFFADSLLALPWLFARPPSQPQRGTRLPWLMVPVVAAFAGFAAQGPSGQHILRLRFRNVAAVQLLGLFHYHFYDALQMVYSRWENVFNSHYNEAKLKEVIAQSRRSIRQDTPWKGRYRGKNLLVFQLESFEAFLMGLKVDGQEVTPFLNELSRHSYTARLQDQSGQGRSSDGEFILLNSLLPPGQRPLVYAYPSNDWCGLPRMLAQQGYLTCYSVPYYGSFWNCRFMSGRYGFTKGLFREQLPNDARYTIGWGLSDIGLVLRLQTFWKDFPRPFFSYTVTMMGHHPYNELTSSQEELHLSSKFQGTLLARYLQVSRVRDSQWRQIVEELKRSGLWQSSVVVLVGDHDARVPYEEMAKIWPGGHYDEVDKLQSDRVFCLIHSPDEKLLGQGPDYAAQVDVTPTLLHLMGVTETPAATLGLNLLSSEKREVIVSKSGYSIDKEYVVLDRGGSYSAYSISSHQGVDGTPLSAQKELQDWYELTRDILRLNLVPTIQNLRL